MKPTVPTIDPAKRTIVPPPPELSAEAAFKIIRAFAVLIAIPFVFEVAAWLTPSKTNLAAATVRSGTQWVLTHLLNEGNRDVYVGREGWLFDQREIDRVVHAKRGDATLHAHLLNLAAQLKSQEIPLLVIAIPNRLALYPEQIRDGKYAGPVRVKEEVTRLDELKTAGIDVLDMTAAMWEFGERNQVYFGQDSHWTPEAMKAVTLTVNKHVRAKLPRLGNNETPIINATIVEHSDAGDLTRRLDPLHPLTLLSPEYATLISIQGFEPDQKSPIVLHGSELIRVFDDPALSFAGDTGKNPHAGFITQFSTLLGRSLDVRGLPQPGESYEDKKLVICVLSMTELVP